MNHEKLTFFLTGTKIGVTRVKDSSGLVPNRSVSSLVEFEVQVGSQSAGISKGQLVVAHTQNVDWVNFDGKEVGVIDAADILLVAFKQQST